MNFNTVVIIPLFLLGFAFVCESQYWDYGANYDYGNQNFMDYPNVPEYHDYDAPNYDSPTYHDYNEETHLDFYPDIFTDDFFIDPNHNDKQIIDNVGEDYSYEYDLFTHILNGNTETKLPSYNDYYDYHEYDDYEQEIEDEFTKILQQSITPKVNKPNIHINLNIPITPSRKISSAPKPALRPVPKNPPTPRPVPKTPPTPPKNTALAPNGINEAEVMSGLLMCLQCLPEHNTQIKADPIHIQICQICPEFIKNTLEYFRLKQSLQAQNIPVPTQSKNNGIRKRQRKVKKNKT